MPAGQKAGIVVIHQLPETAYTLWLRLLGKGNVQRRAIEEINRLMEDSPYQERVLELLSDLKVVLETRKSRDSEDRELIMSLKTSSVYLEHLESIKREVRREALQEGLERGENRAKREITLKLLNRKLGVLPLELIAKIEALNIERLDALSEALLDFQAIDNLIVWLNEN